MSALFITGTDTDVGKTVVTAGIAAALASKRASVAVYKPFQTGSVDDLDMQHVQNLVGKELSSMVSVYGAYRFPVPATPWVSDRAENDGRETIRLETILEKVEQLKATHDWLLVEGAGGIRVPVTSSLDIQDVISKLAIPVLVVARPNLGTINHTLLTVDSLLAKAIPVKGVVISGMPNEMELGETPYPEAVQTVADVFKQWLPVPLLGVLPRFSWSSTETAFSAEQLKAFEPLVSHLEGV